MGVFGQFKNKKKTDKQRKTMKWRRGRRTENKKKDPQELNVEQVQLFSKDMLKNKMKNMKNNVNLSNKRRNRLLKRLKHGQREKDALTADTDVQMTEEATSKTTTSKVTTSKAPTSKVTTSKAPTSKVTTSKAKTSKVTTSKVTKKGSKVKGKQTGKVKATAKSSKDSDEDVTMEETGE
ncbi:uncharacterized protein C11orf98-like [Littorina saxatilis]|uniref:Uncharacterized protein n=1 Tax=Littorina saxatilis TaxID=31220 RepID=A0AAN9B090_9CAEN